MIYVFEIDSVGTPSSSYVSGACLEVYGFTAQRAVQDVQLMHDAIHPDDRRSFDEAGARSLQEMQALLWEGRIHHTDGRERTVLITSRPHHRASGAVEWHGVVTDRSVLAGSLDHDPQRPGHYRREDLLAILGHEIGTPLTAVIAHSDWGLEVLRRHRTTTDTTSDSTNHDANRLGTNTSDLVLVRCFEVIARQARKLQNVRDDLLTMVAEDGGAIPVRPGEVRLVDHLHAAAHTSMRELRVHVDCPPELTCWVQPSHLDQILSNLVANAERFARGHIWLSASRRGERVRISVSDDGPGVAPHLVERLFTRFTHASGTPGPRAGTGLGLFIVRTLVTANNGTVLYQPSHQGARFVVALPTR